VIKGHFGGNRKLQLTCLGVIGILTISVAAFGIVSKPYRLDRISSFITRGQSDPAGGGWIQVMADKCLSSSALFGKGTATIDGYSIDKVMPGITTNYVLINVISTLGWAAGIALVLVIAVFIGRMFFTTKKIKNTYGFYLSLGACTILSVQFAISVLINFNLFPQTDISLPFISYGGVGYIANMALVGIILSVWRRNNLIGSPQKTIVPDKSKFIKFEDGKLIISFK
jgi:cell division protein FtsW (lipid II flippase)